MACKFTKWWRKRSHCIGQMARVTIGLFYITLSALVLSGIKSGKTFRKVCTRNSFISVELLCNCDIFISMSFHAAANVHKVNIFTDRREAVLEDVVTPWASYEFRVQAENELGISLPSEPSPQYNIPPDVPYIYPRNVSGGGGKIGDLTITWTVRNWWKRSLYCFEFQGVKSTWRFYFSLFLCKIKMDPEFITKFIGDDMASIRNSSIRSFEIIPSKVSLPCQYRKNFITPNMTSKCKYVGEVFKVEIDFMYILKLTV